jgi:hypothetical protein
LQRHKLRIDRETDLVPGTQPEREMNGEGRKRAEKGQKMADGTKGVRNYRCNIRMSGWLGNLDSNQD